MQIQTIPYNNMMELYFEDNDIEGVVKKLELSLIHILEPQRKK